jgi:hypothetical protein
MLPEQSNKPSFTPDFRCLAARIALFGHVAKGNPQRVHNDRAAAGCAERLKSADLPANLGAFCPLAAALAPYAGTGAA